MVKTACFQALQSEHERLGCPIRKYADWHPIDIVEEAVRVKLSGASLVYQPGVSHQKQDLRRPMISDAVKMPQDCMGAWHAAAC